MVRKPADHVWSSFQANAHGKDDGLTRPHEVYLGLGRNAANRQLAYRELFRQEPDPVDVQSLRTAINLCVPVGNDRFKAKIERRLEQGISYRPRGRPRKETSG